MVVAVPVHLTPAGGARTVRVFTPPTYAASDRRYRVLYMLDGHDLLDDADATDGRAWRLGAWLGDVLAFLYGR